MTILRGGFATARWIGSITHSNGKLSLDGHSIGAEQVAVRARDAGMDVVCKVGGTAETPELAAQALRRRSLAYDYIVMKDRLLPGWR
jgi:hypothetical protein